MDMRKSIQTSMRGAVTSEKAGNTRMARLGVYLFSAAGRLGDALNGIQPLS